MNVKKILIGSPVCQKPEILSAFLLSLSNLDKKTIAIDYMFVDDNSDELSSQLLAEFKVSESEVTIVPGGKAGEYLCDDESHHWDDGLMLRVANYKNAIIEHAIKREYDYLFLVDSDLVLYPNLLEHLISVDKQIVSEVFWSQWHPDRPLEPNVWLFDEYDLVPKSLGEQLNSAEMDVRQNGFLDQLRIPGLYEVGGLGACTLISRTALTAGVNFEPIKNLTIHGEDRFFCIRAAVLGVDLFVDTHYPAYHIYRETDLRGVQAYIDAYPKSVTVNQIDKDRSNRVTLSMIVKDEEGRYLGRVLNALRGHIDAAVIVDDASSDQTVNICRDALRGIPLHIVRNSSSMFANEVELRKKQWDETIKTNPDWILSLDADEVIESGFWDESKSLLADQSVDLYCCRLYDMWDETHYREDKYWNAHNSYRPFLMRYQPGLHYVWKETPQHCGRFPQNSLSFPQALSEFGVQHFGWATATDRSDKHRRYQLLDPDARHGVKEQYDSILDTHPNLIAWDAE